MRKIGFFVFALLIFLFIPNKIYAVNNPGSAANNSFGIHISNENDLNDASLLVNSSGGDWGYITFVITESERDYNRWQNAFDNARKLHLIPIVRIASKTEGENWTIPQFEEINNWIAFLNSLNWIVENRYVIIGNEPNHAKEWGGTIDPLTYASYLNSFAVKLHEASDDFYVLPAGFDASAKNTADTMDEALFIKKMLAGQPNLFDNLDGWVSHSYPNPDFAGSETDTGRGSIWTFDWELTYLSSLGVTKYLPVFITETGWSNEKISPDEISGKYEYAFKNVWDDERIVAVTPFILNYTDAPFAQFSWKKNDGSFYPYYGALKNIQKIKGKPVQTESGQIIAALSQPIMQSGSSFFGVMSAKNTGQTIWDNNNVVVQADDESLKIDKTLFFDIEPRKTGLIFFKASTTQKQGLLIKSIYLENLDKKRITNSFSIELLITKAGINQMTIYFDKLTSYLGGQLKSPFESFTSK